MNKLFVYIGLAVGLVVSLCCVGLLVPYLFFVSHSTGPCGGTVGSGQMVAGDTKWDTEQMSNATTIVAVGKKLGVPARGIVIALATAMQESSLRNHSGGDRDSAGLFQQRPSMGWGTLAQVTNPEYAAGKFYSVLLKVSGWQTMSVTEAAQRVQRSATPNAYAKWQDAAEALTAKLMGVADVSLLGGGDPAAPCGVDGLDPVAVGPGGWVQPVTVPKIFVHFGQTICCGFHTGVDLSPPAGTPIHAASGGVVQAAACNSSTGVCIGHAPHGYGWYVDIRHPNNIVTRYGHMQSKPAVTVGQVVKAGDVIGFVGETGNATGPHVHFEVHVNVAPGARVGDNNITDPVAFMKAAGAPLPPCCYLQ